MMLAIDRAGLTMDPDPSLRTREVLEATGISERQLRWWAQTGKVPGPIGGFRGTGWSVRWHPVTVDAVLARVAALKACPDCGPRHWGVSDDS